MNPAAQQLGRLGGLAKSKAKTAAVRENGKLGGRPKKPKRIARRRNVVGMRLHVPSFADRLLAVKV